MTIRPSIRGVVLLALAASGSGLSAQEAVVLSGGGARGLAHVGALIGLEERGHDPGIVVGTSMGAVVGALYAAGYEPEEVRARVAAVDWASLFGPTPALVGPDRDIRHPQFALDLDLGRLRLSRGLLGQWRINRALGRLLFDANARSRGDFDRLVRRYRAIATDLETGEVVVLAEGDLARAARASMAVPGFFAPVAWDGRVLVDGGISDNLPTRVARALGAEYIVAIDASYPPREIESQAPFAVIGRAIDLMQEATQRDPIPPNVLIEPDVVGAVSGAQFPEDPTPFFELGLTAARLGLPPPPAVLGRGERPAAAPPDSFSALAVEAPDSALAALARTVMRGAAPGAYDADAVLSAVDRLYDSGLFEGVWPRVEDVPGAAPRLVLRLDAPPQLSLAAAASYDNDRGGRGWVSLDRYRVLFGRPAVVTAAGLLGGLERWGALSARVHPRSRPALTWSMGAYVQERDVRVFEDGFLGAFQVLRPGAWLAFEMPLLLRERAASAALRAEWVESEQGPEGISVGPVIRFESVEADSRVVGVPLLAEAEHRWGETGYSRASLAASRELPLGLVRTAAVLDLAAVFDDDAPIDVYPSLGERHAMPGLRWGEIRGAARAVAGVDFAYPILAGFARLRLRGGGMAPAWDDWGGTKLHAGAQVGGYWLSPIGAVDAGIGASTRGDLRFDVAVGRSF